ncbi:response regulator [Candidatus Nitrospira bockiana]
MLDGVETPVGRVPYFRVPIDEDRDDSSKLKILLVDDNAESLVAIEAVLTAPDRVIVKAMSGEEALKRLLEDDFAVILLDVKMTGLDGYETASLIRARERTRDVPIIFLTSYNKEDSDVIKGYAHGAVDYIVKPLVPEILQSKVSVFLELAKRSRDLKLKNEELERAQSELVRTKAAESLIKHAPDPLFVSDLEANILLANNAASDLLGIRPDELGHEALSRFLSPEDVGQLTAALREVVKKGITRNVRLHPRSAAGKVTPTTLNAAAWRDAEGRIIGAIGILRDMTEYERMLRDLQQSKAELQEKIHDLEKFEEVVVGRELRMIELEKELEQLREKLRH